MDILYKNKAESNMSLNLPLCPKVHDSEPSSMVSTMIHSTWYLVHRLFNTVPVLCSMSFCQKSHAATCGLFHRELYYIEAIYHAADLKSHVSESHAPDQSQHCIKFSKLNLLKTRPSLDGLAPHFFGEDLSFF